MSTVSWQWLWNRTHRLALLLLEPNVLRGAVELVERMERWADHNDVPDGSVAIGDAKFIRGLEYIEFPLTRD